jgi:hypothetical protein
MNDENENNTEQPNEPPSLEMQLFFATNKAAADAKAAEERETKLKLLLESERVDHLLDLIAKDAQAINPEALKLLLHAEGTIVRQDKKLYIDDREVGSFLRQQKQGEWWNQFADTFAAYKSTNGKPADPPDRRKLSMAEYREIRKKNPEALGLRKKK